MTVLTALWAMLRTRWRTRHVRRAMRRTLATTIQQLTAADYAAAHSLPDVACRPVAADLDTPPFYRQHSVRVVNGVRVLGDPPTEERKQ